MRRLRSFSMHVADLDGSATPAVKGKWSATVTIPLHDGSEAALSGATVNGSWSAGGSGSCTTNGSGLCTITRSNISGSTVSFTVNSVTQASNSYSAGANHDPDGDSNGTTIRLTRP